MLYENEFNNSSRFPFFCIQNSCQTSRSKFAKKKEIPAVLIWSIRIRVSSATRSIYAARIDPFTTIGWLKYATTPLTLVSYSFWFDFLKILVWLNFMWMIFSRLTGTRRRRFASWRSGRNWQRSRRPCRSTSSSNETDAVETGNCCTIRPSGTTGFRSDRQKDQGPHSLERSCTFSPADDPSAIAHHRKSSSGRNRSSAIRFCRFNQKGQRQHPLGITGFFIR